jgi:ubiquinone/menaquinone biosynthesis C-methylase UbiE
MTTKVEKHYSRVNLFETIVSMLEKTGTDKKNIRRADLAPVDEFHVRGLQVTKEMADNAGLEKGMEVIDIGCGIGGAARLMAEEYHCHVTGIDITQEYIRTAILLSELTGAGKQTRFLQADALDIPFDDQQFDLAWTQHVQMNIENKLGFYREISRVLKKGGRFIYYDIFSTDEGPLHFPVPWAEDQSISHLVRTNELHSLLGMAGFTILQTKNQTEAGIEFLENILTRIAQQGFPPLSIQLLVGDSYAEKFINLQKNLVEKKIRLESGICQKN